MIEKGAQERVQTSLQRFQWCETYRNSQLNVGWTEACCNHWDEIAQEDHSYAATWQERLRYERVWKTEIWTAKRLVGPMRSPADYPREAAEAGHEFHPTIRPDLQVRQHRRQQFLQHKRCRHRSCCHRATCCMVSWSENKLDVVAIFWIMFSRVAQGPGNGPALFVLLCLPKIVIGLSSITCSLSASSLAQCWQSKEGWRHRCFCRRGSKCSRKNLSLYLRKFYVWLISHSKRRRHVTMYSHKRTSSRDPRNTQETHIATERMRTEQQEVRDHLKIPADEATEGEEAALSILSKAEDHRTFLLEGQKKQILSEARSEIILQDWKTEKRKHGRPRTKQTNSFSHEQLYHAFENWRREQVWLQAELEKRERSSSRDSYKNSLGNGRIEGDSLYWLKLRELNDWEWMIFPDKNCRKVSTHWISLRFNFGNYKINWALWMIPEISTIVRQQAAPGYPTFIVILKLFRVLFESLPAILAHSLTHRTQMVHRETFSKIHLHQMSRQHLVLEMCMQEVLPLRMTNLCLETQEDL